MDETTNVSRPRGHVPPATHRIDRIAERVAAEGSAPDCHPDDLLDTPTLARWLGYSRQFIEIGRSKGWGPPFLKLSHSCVRYRRGDVLEWLAERTRTPARVA